jgi:penicillin-binding protein 1C
LNIPAVKGLQWLGITPFIDKLAACNFQQVKKDQRKLGLSMILGGCGATLEELTGMYSIFANNGRFVSPKYIKEDFASPGEGEKILTPAATFMINEILSKVNRPDFPLNWASTEHMPKIAWKTGTSWGFHDAWTAGLVGPYAIVVWMGNFDGSPNPALVGVEAAAPLFFELADGLRAGGVAFAEPVRQWPLNLRRVEVCRASGDLPNAWCPERGETWFIPGKSPIRVSRVHRAVPVDVASGHVACGPFDPATMRMQVYEYWPSDLAHVFAAAGIPRRRPPPEEACSRGQSWLGSAPMITSPWASRPSISDISSSSEISSVFS